MIASQVKALASLEVVGRPAVRVDRLDLVVALLLATMVDALDRLT